MRLVYGIAAAVCLAFPLQAQTLKGSSQLTFKGDDRVQENTSLTVTRCGGEERILRLKTAMSWNENEKGGEGSVKLDVLKPGQKKPLFSIERKDAVGAAFDLNSQNCLMTVDLGIEDLSWWGVYDLAKGGNLFDTMVPPRSFCLASKRENGQPLAECGYTAGFYVPSDDQIAQPEYGSRSIGNLLLAKGLQVTQLRFTAANDNRARELRSYWDERWSVNLVENLNGRPVTWAASKTLTERPLSLRVEWVEAGLAAIIPLTADGFDIGRATLPDGIKAEVLK
ncbi:hypothetical protein ACFSM5_07005 [Lacibacterium aquatile]|uniref:DUF4424 domain-containing protein n=1 Tax=Lacibacterium aquatile TaxID=1168082 RepID=A0ABW5DQ53_9PROT